MQKKTKIKFKSIDNFIKIYLFQIKVKKRIIFENLCSRSMLLNNYTFFNFGDIFKVINFLINYGNLQDSGLRCTCENCDANENLEYNWRVRQPLLFNQDDEVLVQMYVEGGYDGMANYGNSPTKIHWQNFRPNDIHFNYQRTRLEHKSYISSA